MYQKVLRNRNDGNNEKIDRRNEHIRRRDTVRSVKKSFGENFRLLKKVFPPPKPNLYVSCAAEFRERESIHVPLTDFWASFKTHGLRPAPVAGVIYYARRRPLSGHRFSEKPTCTDRYWKPIISSVFSPGNFWRRGWVSSVCSAHTSRPTPVSTTSTRHGRTKIKTKILLGEYFTWVARTRRRK